MCLVLLIYACVVLCTTCRVLYDGDRLYGSTLLYTILEVDVLPFTTRCAKLIAIGRRRVVSPTHI
jgi:hypothetical protein